MAKEGEKQSSGKLSRDARIGFIGAGRLGSSLAQAMTAAGYQISAVSNRRASRRDWLKSRLAETSVVSEPQDVAENSDIVFITTSDSAIKEVADSVNWRPGQAVIHCSGAGPLGLLDSASATGALVGGFHPLQTFPGPDSSDSLNGITFGIEAPDPALHSWLFDLADDLGGRPYRLTAEKRPAYHAAAVMACGLLAGLTGLAAEVWASSGGLSRKQALESLTPLVKSTANSLGVNGLPGALTGPYVRGDVETVRAHIEASSTVSAEMGAAYSALALAALHIAEEQGNLTSEAANSIKELLVATLRASCENIEEA